MKTKFTFALNAIRVALLALVATLWLAPTASAQNPTLGITNDSSGVTLFWPLSEAGYSLLWTTNLSPPIAWQPYPAMPFPSEDGSNWVVNLASLQATNPVAFFVLVSNTIVPAAPTVVTLAADPVNYTTAALNGTIQPNTLDTTYWFQWGTDVSYGQTTSSSVVSGANNSAVPVELGTTGLSPGTTYHFQLYGSNSDGITSGGDLTFATATPLPDAIVQTFGASNVTTSSAELNGSVNPNGSDWIGFFQWGTNTGYGNSTSDFPGGPTGNVVLDESATISGLAPNTTYHYRVVAFNGGPDEALGNDVAFTTSALQQQQSPTVATLAATSVSSTCATLNGTVDPNGAATIYSFDYEIDNGFQDTSTGTNSVGSDNSVHSFQVTVCGLTPNTEYTYTILAFNSGGGTTGGAAHFTTSASSHGPVPIVQTLATSSVSANSAVLHGSVNPNGLNATAFFEWGTGSTYENITTQQGIGTTAQSDFQATLTNLLASTTYHYRIHALNTNGVSYGADAIFTTACAYPNWSPVPPTNLSPGATTPGGSVTLSNETSTFHWTASIQTTDSSLVIAEFPYGTNNIVQVYAVGTFSSFQIPSGDLQPGTSYVWYMVSYNCSGDESAGTPFYYFRMP